MLQSDFSFIILFLFIVIFLYGPLTDKLLKEADLWSRCQGDEGTRKQGKQESEEERRLTFLCSPCGAAIGTSLPGVNTTFNRRGRHSGEEHAGMQGYFTLLLLFLHLLGSSPACQRLSCGRIVAILHGSCICDLCVNRNGSTEMFPLAFDNPLCSRCLLRYHTCVQSITHTHTCIYKLTYACTYMHKYSTSFCLRHAKKRQAHLFTQIHNLANTPLPPPQVWRVQRSMGRRRRKCVVIHVMN